MGTSCLIDSYYCIPGTVLSSAIDDSSLSATVKASQQEEFSGQFSLISLSSTIEVCCIFYNSVLPSGHSGQLKAMTIVWTYFFSIIS